MSNLEEGKLEGTFWLVAYTYVTTIQYLKIAIYTETEKRIGKDLILHLETAIFL